MAKRSPILGYNHNVRYRGLIFHVQTEDSGLLNPHLFTHLFHGGVIVSTRKLVYDAGSNEEAIKALMQAQHKAVMKELRRGAFDDKIDQYLGGTPGLEPRAGAAADKPIPRGERAPTEVAPMSFAEDNAPIEILNEGLSEPIELPVKRPGTPQPEAGAPAQARTQTGDKTIPVSAKHVAPPPANDISRAPTHHARKPVQEEQLEELQIRDSSPIIEMTVAYEGDDDLGRLPRDTAVEQAVVPQAAVNRAVGAAALKAPQRAAAPPMVTSRAPTGTGAKKNDESQPIQIHSPAPPSAEPPPGERAERPGQYSVRGKDAPAQLKEKTGRIPAIHSAGQPKRGSGANPVVPPQQKGDANRASPQMRVPQVPPRVPNPQPARPPTPPSGSRLAPQPPSRVHATAPIANRTPSPAPPAPGSGVVMTRPAVIVGGPPRPTAPQQRVRKAREDEGRGFGQGLISEKSLDEVILAYLSEDAEDK